MGGKLSSGDGRRDHGLRLVRVLRFGKAVSIRLHASDLREERVPFVLQLTNGRTLTDIYVD